jgi:hypothetical protein
MADITSASTAPCLPPGKAKEAATRVIKTVLGFDLRATRPLWLALISDVKKTKDESAPATKGYG